MSQAGADRRFVNARVITGDPQQARASSFVVREGKFEWVGREADSAPGSGGLRTIDLEGAAVIPGFHDAHTHLSAGALTASWVDLTTTTSPAEAAARVAAAAEGVPRGRWIRGWGWDHTRWPGGAWPTRRDLDAALPEHPVLLTRGDGHVAWLNGAALSRLGWDHRTVDPAGGVILRDPESSEPTGIALETAADLAAAAIPAPDDDERLRAVAAALRRAAAAGITSIEDVLEPWGVEAYDRLRADGRLTARVHGWLPIHLPRAEAEALRRRHPPGDPWLGIGTKKVFLDGTLGSRSAALHEPYADAPQSRGELREDPARVVELVEEADRNGWAVALHAIGDRAVSVAAGLLARLPRRPRERCHRVEHVQVARRDDLARLAQAQAAASVQPIHYVDDQGFLNRRLGESRASGAYPLRSLAEAGVMLAFGSDWPIAALDPVRNILAASVARVRIGGPGAREAVSLEAALRAATAGPAAVRGDPRLGRIAAGCHADFVVLSCDPFGVPEDELSERLAVKAAFAGGRQVYPEPPEV